MPAVKEVAEPCAGKPHARIEVAAGGNRSVGLGSRTVQAPPADPTTRRASGCTPWPRFPGSGRNLRGCPVGSGIRTRDLRVMSSRDPRAAEVRSAVPEASALLGALTSRLDRQLDRQGARRPRRAEASAENVESARPRFVSWVEATRGSSRDRRRIELGKLIATTQATVDGVIDPVGEWVQADGDHGDYSFERQARSSGLVLGRKTYEGLAGYWPSQSGNWADMVNPMPKYVGSNTLSGDLVERDPARGGPRGLDPEAEGRGRW